MSQKVYSKF